MTRLQFSDEESFGLFMEGLRSLQLYEDEAAKEHPQKALLERGLHGAVEPLRSCVDQYSFDLLPRLYLAVALTVRNQHVYVERLVELSPAFRALGSHLAFRDMNVSLTLSVPDRRFAANRALEESSKAESVRDLSRRPWPLLEEATRLLLDLVGDSELDPVARYNLAQIYGRRGDKYLQDGIDALHPKPPIANVQMPIPSSSRWQGFLDWVSPQRRTKRQAEVELSRRRWFETCALSLQYDILLESLRVRQAAIGEPLDRKAFKDGCQLFEKIPGQIDKENLPYSYKADLEADYYTKFAYVEYELALNPSAAGRGFTAASCFERSANLLRTALEVKEHWNPAQVYLAMFRLIEAGMAEAHTEFLKHQRDSEAIPAANKKGDLESTVKGITDQERVTTVPQESQRLAELKLKKLKELSEVTLRLEEKKEEFERRIAESVREMQKFLDESGELFAALQGLPLSSPSMAAAVPAPGTTMSSSPN